MNNEDMIDEGFFPEPRFNGEPGKEWDEEDTEVEIPEDYWPDQQDV